MVTALIFGVAGEPGALLVFAAAGLGTALVTSITRYSASPA